MWLPPPPPDTAVCAGFDGSDSDDWTAIKAETRDGFIFTPRYGPDRRPTIWNPADYDGKIPRDQVHAAWDEITTTYRLRRAYCDPGFHDEKDWTTEIESWAAEWGEEVFVSWPTTSPQRMFAALRRFEADLDASRITNDGCPVTVVHMRNARRVAGRSRTYRLGKPAAHQKIDVAVTTVLAHEAAADERAAGWPEVEPPPLVFSM